MPRTPRSAGILAVSTSLGRASLGRASLGRASLGRASLGRAAPAIALAIALGPLGAPAALADQPHPWGVWLQTPASPIMDQIDSLHRGVTIIIILVTLFVFAMLGIIIVRFNARAHPRPATFSHNTPLEVLWTVVPVAILVGIAFPSFRLLFAQDRVADSDLTIKVTGHQWYWSYAFPDQGIAFDSNIVDDSDLKPGQPRLLTVDKPLVLPVGKVVRIQITADDVIHSWSVPSLGLKTDAIPGRLNETWVKIERPGTYYGQCSQLCGINHGFMPIEVRAVPPARFAAWLKEHKPAGKTSDSSSWSAPVAVAAVSAKR